VPDARLERGDVVSDGDPFKVTARLWLSGTLRGTGEAFNAVIGMTLKLGAAGRLEIAEAEVEQADLDKLRAARLSP